MSISDGLCRKQIPYQENRSTLLKRLFYHLFNTLNRYLRFSLIDGVEKMTITELYYSF